MDDINLALNKVDEFMESEQNNNSFPPYSLAGFHRLPIHFSYDVKVTMLMAPHVWKINLNI